MPAHAGIRDARVRAISLLCALAALPAGCGGDEDGAQLRPGQAREDRPEIQRVVSRYVAAYLEGRGAEACGLYTDALRARIERRARAREVGSCAKAIEVASNVALTGQPPSVRRRLRALLGDPRRVSVELEGNRAVAGLELPGSERLAASRLGLERTGGQWRIAEVGASEAK